MVTALLLSLASCRLSFWSKSRRIRRTGGNKGFLGFFPSERISKLERLWKRQVSLNCSVLQPQLWRRLCIAGKSFIFSCLLFSRFLCFPCQTSLWNKKRWGVRSVISMLDMEFSSRKRFLAASFSYRKRLKQDLGEDINCCSMSE